MRYMYSIQASDSFDQMMGIAMRAMLSAYREIFLCQVVYLCLAESSSLMSGRNGASIR